MGLRKIVALVMVFCLYTTSSYAFFGGNKELDNKRVQFVNRMAGYIDEYYSVKGYYPLANGEYSLPAVTYLNSNMTKVDYPIHFNNVTVYDYEVLIDELRSVLGDKFVNEDDPVEGYGDPQAYISKYYCAGNTYMITANLTRGNKLTTHNVFKAPSGVTYTNKSKITDFKFNHGFMHRYSIGSISNKDNYLFSLPDYRRLESNDFKMFKCDERLAKAVMEKQYDKVADLIAKGAELNPVHENFNRVSAPLIFAVRNNDFRMAKMLVDAGCDVNARGSYQDVVLIYALSQKEVNHALVKMLVDAGANVNVPNFFGISPFVGVCLTGEVELVKLFIKNGANLNQDYFYHADGRFKKAHTPLKAAIREGKIEVVKILIENGCEFKNGTPGSEQSPLEYAKEMERDDIVNLLSHAM